MTALYRHGNRQMISSSLSCIHKGDIKATYSCIIVRLPRLKNIVVSNGSHDMANNTLQTLIYCITTHKLY